CSPSTLGAGVLEIGQLYVPGRHPVLEDFCSSAVGALVGIAIAYPLRRFRVSRAGHSLRDGRQHDEALCITATQWDRLENPGKVPLELIEVQIGSYLGEDDIIRTDDVYNREAHETRR